ncbi:polymorphic toxin-type HINT domain-containing protein, partial [Kitasatospora sp. NPDC057512]|uniref:polymorphic toxin-type HINT domain-containing protein n=1 Tax=Kitasatospora sp. NPDC057512 TaxID=3346154 RepID=UPI0036A2935C
TKARRSAAAAASDRAMAGEASRDAVLAKQAGENALTAARSLDDAMVAADSSKIAMSSALAAGADANDAANSAVRAGGFADQAGAQSARVRQAAASTQRHAQEATRAAKAAAALLDSARTFAAEARSLAASAGAHAQAAAQAAEEAAQHAGEAATAAANSRAHAEQAQILANEAAAAVDKANTVRDLAQRTESEDLAARTADAIDKAADARAAYDDSAKQTGEAVQQARRYQDEADRLAQAVLKPDADTARLVTDGRKLALLSVQISGDYDQAAARVALTGGDAAVLDYIRSGRTKAVQADDRARVVHLATESEMAGVRSAAAQALKGDAQAVTAFLATGQYDAAAKDYQISVAQSSNEAGPGVKAAAQKALSTGTVDALREYLGSGRYNAQVSDDKVLAAQLRNGAGPELDAAARVALEGTPEMLRGFVAGGRYMAQRKDELTGAHQADIERLIAEGAANVAYAQQAAAEAAQAAAVANNAQTEAEAAAGQAKAAATKAAGYASQAQDRAKQAEGSAARAATASKNANAARSTANAAYASARYSVQRARYSEVEARGSANAAYSAANEARASALAAGKDAQTAAAAAASAFDTAAIKGIEERKAEALALELKLEDAVVWAQRESAKQQQTEEQRKKIEDEDRKGGGGHDPIGGGPYDFLHPNIPWLPAPFLAPVDWAIDTFVGPAAEAALLAYNRLLSLYSSAKSLLGTVFLDTVPTLAKQAGGCVRGIVQGDAIDRIPDCTRDPRGVLARPASKLLDLTRQLPFVGNKITPFLEDAFSRVGICLTPNSFPAGTKVLMADGGNRPIEQVSRGDRVLATDPETGTTTAQPVDATIQTPDDRDFVDLTVTDGTGGSGTVTATAHHPIWSQNRQAWVDAADVVVGDQPRTADGASVTVASVRHWTGLQPAYNLTVRDVHTYYVLAGATPVLVHNGDCDRIALGLSEYNGDKYMLDNFGDKHDASHWHQWSAEGKDFEKIVRAALSPDSTTEIYFNLKGITDAKEWAKTANLNNPYASDLTAWELAMMRDAPPSVQKRIHWYNGDDPADSPFKD